MALDDPHPIWPEGPDCDEQCPGKWSQYHDGFAWGYEKAVAAERARIRAAVEGLPGSELTFDRKVLKPGRFDGNAYTAPETKITISVTTASATDGLIDRTAVLAIIDGE